MDRKIRGAIIGMVMGDAYINVRNRLKDGKYKYESSEMRIVHSLTQRDYCEYKRNKLNKWLNRHSTLRSYKTGPGKKYYQVGFGISHPYFRQIKRWCYPNGRKTISEHILDMLTPEGLAYWYMDDGSASKCINQKGWISSVSTNIATFCSLEEAEIMQYWFKQKYAINWKIRCKKQSPKDKAFFLVANTENSKEFIALIKMFIIPSMLYKIAHVAIMNTHERQTPIGICGCGNLIYQNRYKGKCSSCYSKLRRRQLVMI